MEEYLKSQHSPKKSPHGALIKKPGTRLHTQVSCPSCISRMQIKQSMVHSSRRWQKTLLQVGRTSTQSTSRMCNMFCPSTSMIKLIMRSGRSNEMTVTKVTCPQRMMIIQPLAMCQIFWKCPLQIWKDDVTSEAPTKNVTTKGQWCMDKMKKQDVQLMQASEDTMITINDWSFVMGTTPPS